MAITISQSKVKSWRQCRQQYAFKYVEKLIKKRIKRPFQFGRIVHEMLDAFANARDPFEKLDEINLKNANMFNAEREEYGNIIEDIRVIMSEYFSHWGDDSIKYDRHNGTYAEHRFEIEIAKGIHFTGIMDGVGRSKGLRWLIEHKTFTRAPNEDARWRNLQSCVYLRANDILGWKPLNGTCWNYIKSKPPSRPELLKSGELSKKSIDTLPSVVHDVITEHNLNPKNYTDLLDKAKSNRDSYFFRSFTPASRETIDLVFSDFVESAKEIAQYEKKSHIKNIGQHCDFCDYESICRAEIQGLDVDYVKSKEFKTKND